MFRKLYNYLYRLPYWKLLIVCFAVFSLISVLLVILNGIIGMKEMAQNPFVQGLFAKLHPVIVLFLVGLVYPLIETLYAQVVAMEVLIALFSKLHRRLLIALIAASLLFGLIHPYSIAYVTGAFIIGILLNYMYIIGRRRKETAMLLPFIVHAAYNSLAFSIIIILN